MIKDKHRPVANALIEPGAGGWHTWVLASDRQIVPPAPPNRAASLAEIQTLKQLAQQRDAATLGRITYWNSGAPVYRWNEIAVAEMAAASYPSAHSCFSATSAAVLAYLFPPSAAAINAAANEAGESRIWAGIHFRSDITAGLHLGEQVAAKAMSVVQGDK